MLRAWICKNTKESDSSECNSDHVRPRFWVCSFIFLPMLWQLLSRWDRTRSLANHFCPMSCNRTQPHQSITLFFKVKVYTRKTQSPYRRAIVHSSDPTSLCSGPLLIHLSVWLRKIHNFLCLHQVAAPVFIRKVEERVQQNDSSCQVEQVMLCSEFVLSGFRLLKVSVGSFDHYERENPYCWLKWWHNSSRMLKSSVTLTIPSSLAHKSQPALTNQCLCTLKGRLPGLCQLYFVHS